MITSVCCELQGEAHQAALKVSGDITRLTDVMLFV